MKEMIERQTKGRDELISILASPASLVWLDLTKMVFEFIVISLLFNLSGGLRRGVVNHPWWHRPYGEGKIPGAGDLRR